MKNKLLVLSVLPLLALTSCKSTPKSTGFKPKKNDQYEVKTIDFIRNKNAQGVDEVSQTVDVRFYQSYPHVPYIGVNQYFDTFFDTDLDLEITEDTYKYSIEERFFSLNTSSDVLSSNDLESFSSHPGFKYNTGKVFYEDHTVTTEKQISNFDLGSYDIYFYGDEDDAYAPISLLGKIAGGYSLYNIAYNGTSLYEIDFQGTLGDVSKRGDYYSSFYDNIDDLSKDREKDVAYYAYQEICFAVDNLRGDTKQLVFGDDNLKELGLNRLLEKYHPDVKKYLLSIDKSKFYQGYNALYAGLYDGGHSGALVNSSVYSDESSKAKNNKDFADLLNGIINDAQEKLYVQASAIVARMGAMGASTSSEDRYHYDSTNKIAYIVFNQFVTDYDAWDNYYNGTGDIPVSTDTYASIRDKLYRAKADGAENIVLDLSTNGGGDSSALIGVVGLFNNALGYFQMKDTVNNFVSTEQCKIDVNLDGEFNDDDVTELAQFNFNVGVLTSKYSFSCGNLLPHVMKELGYKTIGKRSGGGSCAIRLEISCEGMTSILSSCKCLVDSNGDNIDAGVPVDYEIDTPAISARLQDYSGFYNFADIATYLESAYQ